MSNKSSPEKIFTQYLHNNISKIMPIDTFSEISIVNIELLRGTANATYLIKLEFKNTHTKRSICIVAKHFELRGTYLRTTSFLKLYGMGIFSVRLIPTEKQRLTSEVVCTNKMKKTKIKAPELNYVDWDNYYLFNNFIEGIAVKDLIHQIKKKQIVANWQKVVLEELGKGLAEIHLKLKVTHGDTAPSNWIIEKTTGNLFLVDWETAGRGDPAWDIAHLIYEIAAKFDDKRESMQLFKKVFVAIMMGYKAGTKNENVTQSFLKYWYIHALSVSPLIHEMIFKLSGVQPSRGCRFLRTLQLYYIFKHYPENQRRPIINKFIFLYLKAFISLYSILTSISRGLGSSVITVYSSCAPK